MGRLWKVRRGGVTLAQYEYDANGNREKVVRANGTTTFYDFDEQNRLTGLAHRPTGNTNALLAEFTYDLAADGRRQQVQEVVYNPASSSVSYVSRTITYRHDAANRLTGETRKETSHLRAGGAQQQTANTNYDYDQVGNRLSSVADFYEGIGEGATLQSRTEVENEYDGGAALGNDWLTKSTTTTKNGAGQVTGTSVVSYGYDQNGSQTSVTVGSGADAQTTRLSYSYEGRLLTSGPVDASGNATVAGYTTYTYDAHGKRIGVTENTGTAQQSATRFLVDENLPNEQVLEEWQAVNGTETLQASYAYGEPDELLRLAQRDAQNGTYPLSYYLGDGLSSTRQLTTDTGIITDSYAYDVWGNEMGSAGATANDYRFNGQRRDKSGLYHLRARYYNPGTGRFLSHDPILGVAEDPITQHRYLYGNNDPAHMVDPSGEFSMCETLTNLGIKTALTSRVATAAYRVYEGAAFVSSASEIYYDYISTGEINAVDTAFLVADAFLPSVGLTMFKKVFGRWLCFTADTPVVMANGSTKAIEKIKVGDLVLSRDEKTGETATKKVAQTFKWQVESTLVLHFQSSEQDKIEKIETTDEHPFYVEGKGFVPAKELGVGTSIVTRAGPAAKLVKIERKHKTVTVYNFEVEDFHTYFVGQKSGGLWVHNTCGYPVHFEVQLPTSVWGSSDSVHFNRANEMLEQALRQDPKLLESLAHFANRTKDEMLEIVSSTGGRENPFSFTWHHATAAQAGGRSGVLQLVLQRHHRRHHRFYHPTGRGGYQEWAMPAGAPPRRR